MHSGGGSSPSHSGQPAGEAHGTPPRGRVTAPGPVTPPTPRHLEAGSADADKLDQMSDRIAGAPRDALQSRTDPLVQDSRVGFLADHELLDLELRALTDVRSAKKRLELFKAVSSIITCKVTAPPYPRSERVRRSGESSCGFDARRRSRAWRTARFGSCKEVAHARIFARMLGLRAPSISPRLASMSLRGALASVGSPGSH